jgi:hypothetical protein
MPLAGLDPTRPTPVELLGMQLVVWQDGSGTWRCFQDACPHRLAPLSGEASFLCSTVGPRPGCRCQVQRCSVHDGTVPCLLLGTLTDAACWDAPLCERKLCMLPCRGQSGGGAADVQLPWMEVQRRGQLHLHPPGSRHQGAGGGSRIPPLLCHCPAHPGQVHALVACPIVLLGCHVRHVSGLDAATCSPTSVLPGGACLSLHSLSRARAGCLCALVCWDSAVQPAATPELQAPINPMPYLCVLGVRHWASWPPCSAARQHDRAGRSAAQCAPLDAPFAAPAPVSHKLLYIVRACIGCPAKGDPLWFLNTAG